MLKELANVFARYAERRDARLAELAQKMDNGEITIQEMNEFMAHMERMEKRFWEERKAILGKNG